MGTNQMRFSRSGLNGMVEAHQALNSARLRFSPMLAGSMSQMAEQAIRSADEALIAIEQYMELYVAFAREIDAFDSTNRHESRQP